MCILSVGLLTFFIYYKLNLPFVKKKKKKKYKIKLYLNYPVTNKTSATANARYSNTHLGKPWF